MDISPVSKTGGRSKMKLIWKSCGMTKRMVHNSSGHYFFSHNFEREQDQEMIVVVVTIDSSDLSQGYKTLQMLRVWPDLRNESVNVEVYFHQSSCVPPLACLSKNQSPHSAYLGKYQSHQSRKCFILTVFRWNQSR